MKRFNHIKGDISGALSAMVITLPISIGYGMLVYAPLGVEFAPQGALAGIYAAVFAGFVAALCGGTSIQITGPCASLSLLLTSVVAGLSVNPYLSEVSALRPVIIMGLTAFCVFIAGLTQLLLGIFRLGTSIKYIPYPVISGFMNGVAVVLIVKQIKPMLGVCPQTPLLEILRSPQPVHAVALIVGGFTLCVIFLSGRFIKRIPATLTALVAGTLLFYLLQAFSGSCALVPVMGDLAVKWPRPDIWLRFNFMAQYQTIRILLPDLLLSGVILGLVASMESLLSAVTSDGISGNKHASNRELIGQGLGNMVASFFGAIPSAGSISRSLANFKAGGRTPLSAMLCSVFLLVGLHVLGSLVGKVPMVVFAAIVMAVGFSLFDSWTVSLFKKMATLPTRRIEITNSVLVITIVAVLTITVNLTIAVAIGLVLATLLFTSKISKILIKSVYYGDQCRSRRMRNQHHQRILEEKGRQIAVFELQGALFFGSAENFGQQIESWMENAVYGILDMRRVIEIDGTGARTLTALNRKLKQQNKYLLVSYLTENHPLWGILDSMEVVATLGRSHFFPDTDAALEWAEDHLLAANFARSETNPEMTLKQMALVKDFAPRELEVLTKYFTPRTYKLGEYLFREGDSGNDLFLLMQGSVSVKIWLPQNGRQKRLITCSPGVIIGEVALFDGNPRSADVWVDEDSKVLQLTHSDFTALQARRPELACKLILNIARELSARLRRSSEEVRSLEDD